MTKKVIVIGGITGGISTIPANKKYVDAGLLGIVTDIKSAFDFPASITIRKSSFGLNVNQAKFMSDLTRKISIQHANAGYTDFWEGSIATPRLTRAQIQELRAWVSLLRGRQGRFFIGDPDKTSPQTKSGTFPNGGTVNGAGQTGRTLATNWPHLSSLVLMAGDHIQVGDYLYEVLVDATTDGSGDVTLDIAPGLRESPSSGAVIITENPVMRARLVSDFLLIETNIAKQAAVALFFMEAPE